MCEKRRRRRHASITARERADKSLTRSTLTSFPHTTNAHAQLMSCNAEPPTLMHQCGLSDMITDQIGPCELNLRGKQDTLKCIRKLVYPAISRRSRQGKGRGDQDRDTGEGFLEALPTYSKVGAQSTLEKISLGKIRICVRRRRKLRVLGYDAPATQILRVAHQSMHATTADGPHAAHGRLSAKTPKIYKSSSLACPPPAPIARWRRAAPPRQMMTRSTNALKRERRGRRSAEDSNGTCRSRRCKRTRRRRKACA